MQENYLSDVELKVHVEIGQVSITLRELMQLKIGDTFQTTQLATNVKLVINGRDYAEGFLVDVSGKCAVRITRLLAQSTGHDLANQPLATDNIEPRTNIYHTNALTSPEFSDEDELDRYSPGEGENKTDFEDDEDEDDDYDDDYEEDDEEDE